MGWPRARTGTRAPRSPPRSPPRTGSSFPGRSSLLGRDGGRRAGDNPKRAGAGSFLQEFPAPHTSPGLPAPPD